MNAARAAEALAAGAVGIAVMGGVMRAADPSREMKALLAVVTGAPVRRATATPKHVVLA
jgi:thiamine-phosphate pyrophosphorylase